jgi:hypothetical protein
MNLKDRLAAQRRKNEQPNPFVKGLLRDNDLTPTTKETCDSIREAWERYVKFKRISLYLKDAHFIQIQEGDRRARCASRLGYPQNIYLVDGF